MSYQSSVSHEPVSINLHYRGLCCPFCVDRRRWGRKKRGGRAKSWRAKRKTLRTHRIGH